MRADAERTGGVIHTAMFERLLLSEFAVADLTTANANVFYELGVRHTARRNTTQLIFADGHLPFDLNYARALPYMLGANNTFGAAEASALREALQGRLAELMNLQREEAATDSPLFQVLKGYEAPDLAHLRTDTFRERVQYSEKAKQALEVARRDKHVKGIVEVEKSLGEFDESEAGILVDILLSYRACSQWELMVNLVERMPETLKRQQMIQEQFGLALNRVGNRERAIRVLEGVIEKHGKNPETCGILGRVYKDQWDDAVKANQRARGFLRSAINMYVQGFEADWRDYYPGINAVTLLNIEGSEDSLKLFEELLPVVRYSVLQRFKMAESGTVKLNYWDYATMLELAVLANNKGDSDKQLDDALSWAKEDWERQTTANNLRIISTTRRERGEDTAWLDALIGDLAPHS